MARRLTLASAFATGLLAALAIALIPGSASGDGPVFQPSTWNMTFDFVKVGNESAIQTLTVTNEGHGAETFTSVTVRGPDPSDFTIEDENCTGTTLQDQDSCHVDVIFKPTQSGTRVARLRFLDNTPCGDIVQLAGSGTNTRSVVAARSAACSGGTTTVTKTTTVGGGGGGGGTQTVTTTQTITVSAAPSANPPTTILPCKSRRNFNVRAIAPKGRSFKSITATIPKRKLKVTRGKHVSIIHVDLRGLPHARFAMRVKGKLSPRGTFKLTKHYVTCTAGKAPKVS